MSDTIATAFKILVSKGIHSVPVLDEFGVFVTFLDVVDICHFALSVLDEKEVSDADFDLGTSNVFEDHLCSEIANMNQKTYVGFDQNDNLLKAMRMMVSMNDIHRLPLISTAGELEGIISQSRIVRFLAENIELFPIHSQTVGEAHIGNRNVVTVEGTSLMLDAFNKIRELGISGVAVVDIDGQLKGNISGSDIKFVGLDGKLLRKMFSPINSILGLTQDRLAPIYITEDTSIKAVFELFVEQRIQRAYIVNEEKVPVGVVSLVHLMEKILDYC
eukprot:TRINITY_DN10538_c0_g1_i1.p1 TRINITY_DN10538_c0_g1~~TRINITY_DN10538_c0_g1_i1.p1  ORF type:complete len:315 (-),score=80.70 TRINITY_DN10538_c0_g1_i1:35-856(-)